MRFSLLAVVALTASIFVSAYRMLSAFSSPKAFTPGGLHKSTQRPSQSTGGARASGDQLYKHLETVPENDFEGFSAKLVQAGGTLEYLKYADALFEILLVGGLIQPGGSYLDDGAPMSPFSIFNARNPPDIEELKKYVDVFNKLNRRFKYLQKPFEEQSLLTLLQYIGRWSSEQRDKLVMTLGLLPQGLVTAACLQSLTKDHIIKNGKLTHYTFVQHVTRRTFKL
ncbi:hypothetical protein BD769DRAFT_1678188 [Suillus cothurnatus]|nr:hypothetical protein BD769DRAFT_1678188 [Suillus cothurnatus]